MLWAFVSEQLKKEELMTTQLLRNRTAMPRCMVVLALGCGFMACVSEGPAFDQEEAISIEGETHPLSDTSSPIGLWYLTANGYRLELSGDNRGARGFVRIPVRSLSGGE